MKWYGRSWRTGRTFPQLHDDASCHRQPALISSSFRHGNGTQDALEQMGQLGTKPVALSRSPTTLPTLDYRRWSSPPLSAPAVDTLWF